MSIKYDPRRNALFSRDQSRASLFFGGFMETVGEWLFDKYESLRNRNQRYSLRAFAKKLDIPNSRLIQIIHHKRYVNDELAQQLINKLQPPMSEQQKLLELIKKEEHHRKVRKSFGPPPSFNTKLLQLDQFSLISDPIHYSLLALMETDTFQSNIQWISNKLNKDSDEIKTALDCLKRLGFIEIEPEIKLIDAKFVETPSDIPHQALRDHQSAKIKEALVALDELPVHIRDHTSITIPVNPEKLPEAKKIIKEFRRKMSQLLSSGQTSDVYHLCIQLFPTTRIEND